MLRYSALIGVLLSFRMAADAQELFVFSEPASNMPARTTGLRLNNWLMNEQGSRSYNYHMFPEVMIGVSKKVMLHADGIFSNRAGLLAAEGVGLYGKYRFYSKDRLYRHFRIAAFVRYASNNSELHQDEISVYGHNSGYQLGAIATQLLHRTALSATVYYEKNTTTAAGADYQAVMPDYAFNYILSSGHLFFPRKYRRYGQTNFNVMLEALGQVQPGRCSSFLDIAPSVQLIFNSQTRVDIGYRKQLYSGMKRTTPDGFLLRIEHVIYNVW